jgi:hypothetical protein
MNCEPTCDNNPSNTTDYSIQTNSIWYNNPDVRPNYPIIHLDDIEIHCIHESSVIETLIKFKRRMERFRDIIKTNSYTIFYIMTWTNLFTIHTNNDYKPYISRFLSNNKDENNKYIFLGPTNYIANPYYINDSVFYTNINRKIDNVNNQINFQREASKIMEYIIKN